jgi:hypothetical protein
MSIIKQKDKRTGITYVYESESYWDKEKQQPRSNRKLIGKLDEETGEIVSTDGRGKKRTVKMKADSEDTALCDELKLMVKEKDIVIRQLTSQNEALKKERAAVLKDIGNILNKYEGKR